MIKLHRGFENGMSEMEKDARKCLLLPVAANSDVFVIDVQDSLEEVLNKAKKHRIEQHAKLGRSRYIKVGWIPCNTFEVERLFSKCKLIFSEFRMVRSMDILLYLRANRQHWDIHTFRRAIGNWEQELEGLGEDAGAQFMEVGDGDGEE